jgi:transposase-like protein
MPGNNMTAEQIVAMLRQIEILNSQGKVVLHASKETGISEVTYYRWRKEYGGLQVDLAKRLKELKRENAWLKRVVAEFSLEKAMIRELASGDF